VKRKRSKTRKREIWSSQVLKENREREREALPPARFLFSCETAYAESVLYSLDAAKVPGRVSFFLSVGDEASFGNASLFSNDAFVVLQ